MSTSKSRFTVAKLDAGMAILLTSDHHLIEFPSLLLPSGVIAGSIIDLSVAQNLQKEIEEKKAFDALQNEVHNLYAVQVPQAPELIAKNVTQTSIVLEWPLLDLATADLRDLSLYKNGSKLGKIPNITTTTTKLSGLALDTDYIFQLVLRSSAGIIKSNELKVRTHKMTNLTGLNVCISNLKNEEREAVSRALERIGAKPPHERVRIDTTHFITARGMGDEFKKAQSMNIPIVLPEFIEACETEGRIMRAGTYYLDSDPALRIKKNVIRDNIPQQTNQDASNSIAAVTENNDSDPTQTVTAESMLPVQSTSLTDGSFPQLSSRSSADRTDEGPHDASEKPATEVAQSTSQTGARAVETQEPTDNVSAVLGENSIHQTTSLTQPPSSTNDQSHESGAKQKTNEHFPPSMGRTATAEDMEDVAL